MATVYQASDRRLERKVAIKVIHAHLAEQPDFVRRFISEARAAAGLSSQHVVAVHDQGVATLPTGDRPYLVMELMSGPDLRSELNTYGSLPLGISLELTRQVLEGLAVAHDAGIIHRDIKPENVLLTEPLETTALEPRFQAKLTDFGLARAATDATSTHTNSMLGTVGYVAPEFISDGTTSKTADIYSVGVMLYELIAGQLPFRGETAMNVAFKHVNETMPRLSDQADWMPATVDSLIALFTAKSPSKRPVNARAALDALTDVIASLPQETLIRRIPVFPSESARVPSGGTSVLPADAVAPVASKAPAPGGSRSDASPEREPADDALPASIPPAMSHTAVLERRHHTEVSQDRPRRRRWPVLLLLLIALIGGSAYGLWWYYSEGPGLRVNVPNVINLAQADAEAALTNAGLTYEVTEDYSDDIEAGSVISVDPDVGEPIHPSQPVTMVVSLGIEHVVVPDVAGKTQDEASTILQDGRLTLEVTEAYSETVPAGTVISQSPEPGQSVPHSSLVQLTVSKGREPISVPDLTRDKLDSANARLEELGLTSTVTEEFSDTVEAGVVMTQEPVAGESRYRGDSIALTVSKGPELIEVPNVFGKQEGEATQILEDAGFVVAYDRFLGGYFGTVRAQSPGAGEKVKPGSVITITIV